MVVLSSGALSVLASPPEHVASSALCVCVVGGRGRTAGGGGEGDWGVTSTGYWQPFKSNNRKRLKCLNTT